MCVTGCMWGSIGFKQKELILIDCLPVWCYPFQYSEIENCRVVWVLPQHSFLSNRHRLAIVWPSTKVVRCGSPLQSWWLENISRSTQVSTYFFIYRIRSLLTKCTYNMASTHFLSFTQFLGRFICDWGGFYPMWSRTICNLSAFRWSLFFTLTVTPPKKITFGST